MFHPPGLKKSKKYPAQPLIIWTLTVESRVCEYAVIPYRILAEYAVRHPWCQWTVSTGSFVYIVLNFFRFAKNTDAAGSQRIPSGSVQLKKPLRAIVRQCLISFPCMHAYQEMREFCDQILGDRRLGSIAAFRAVFWMFVFSVSVYRPLQCTRGNMGKCITHAILQMMIRGKSHGSHTREHLLELLKTWAVQYSIHVKCAGRWQIIWAWFATQIQTHMFSNAPRACAQDWSLTSWFPAALFVADLLYAGRKCVLCSIRILCVLDVHAVCEHGAMVSVQANVRLNFWLHRYFFERLVHQKSCQSLPLSLSVHCVALLY